MVGASKILTVSYGTFSCTLEGFDEPFSTMKSIAEYFRDLAADDRYFGAEPPTPDAEMLHRIAEREVQRRVEARVGDDGIVLRQMDHAETAEPAAAPAEVPVAATLADLAPAPLAEDEPAAALTEPEAETAAPAAEEAPAYGAPEYTATNAAFPPAGFEPSEDLQETEELAAAEDAATEELSLEAGADTEATQAETYQETYEEVAETFEETYEEVEETYFAEEPTEEIAATPEYEAEPAAEVFEDQERAMAEPAPAADAASAEPAFLDDDNSVAAKLSRIRAVVGAAVAEEADDADQPVAEAANIDASFASAFEDLNAQDDETELSDELEGDEAELTEFGEASEADLAALDGEMPHETYASDKDATLDTEAATDETAELSPADESDDDKEAVDLSDYIAEPGEVAEDDIEPEIVEVQSAAAEEPQATDQEEDDATEDDAVEDVLEDDVDSSLSDADEAELVAMLRKAEAARQDGDEDESILDQETLEDTAEADASETGTEEVADEKSKSGDSSFDRILEETNSKLDDTEGTRRRSAIAHLKAAVAATKADRLLGRNRKDEVEAEELSQYRDDLAKVVRPRREFEKSETSSERPTPLEERPSPLVLVSEQRVDQPEAEKAPEPSTGSVLPRRVSMAASAAEDDAGDNGMDSYADVDTSFAEFAEEMGAVELPDLLEAAAAYSAFVEGNKHFSRPQLMRKVASYEKTEEYTREAGLRSFGQLLRQGKIQKLRRGQFTIREDTRFNPEARLAGE